MMRKLTLLLVASFVAFAADSKLALDGIDSFSEKALQDWKCAGFAIAIIQDGKVVFFKGYGLRDRKHSLPVTPRTLFAIGGATKSFTVTSLGERFGRAANCKKGPRRHRQTVL